MVQVARVSSREKAQDLLRKLRAKGYAAVLSQQGDSWKVMVGPELSREVAVSTKNRLNADAAIGVSDAWVQAYKP
jgi:cell division septation protein DedD